MQSPCACGLASETERVWIILSDLKRRPCFRSQTSPDLMRGVHLLSRPNLSSSSAMASLLQSLADRLSSLSIIPGAPSDSSVPVRTYAFKPKGGDARLVLVVAEESKDIGKASALAKTLGFKDMRAAEDDYIREIVGEGKATGTHECARKRRQADADALDAAVSPLALSEQNAASVLLVVSNSLASSTAASLSLAGTHLSPADLQKYISSTKVSTKEVSFSERGSGPAATGAAAPGVSGAVPVAKPSNPSSKPGKDSDNATKEDPSNIASLGVTIRKTQEDFGGWYKQVLTYGDLIDYYDVSGCYILRPASYGIWEVIQSELVAMSRTVIWLTRARQTGSTPRSRSSESRTATSPCLCPSASSSAKRITSRASQPRSLGSPRRRAVHLFPLVLR